MKSEISVMKELQHFWSLAMKADDEAERSRKAVKTWENRLKEAREDVDRRSEELKNLRVELKQKELSLEDVETRTGKLEQRRDQLKSEREIEAQNSELLKLNDERDGLELEIIDLLDRVETDEGELDRLKAELEETEKQVVSDIAKLKEKIISLEEDSSANRKSFEELSASLESQHRSRFLKLIKSKDGIAIASLQGEICSHCNFVIPSSIASAVEKGEIQTCTNCGRFLY